MENRNLQWNKRVKVPLILIFSVNTNHESVAYRSFSPSKFEARGARKVTTGIDIPVVPFTSWGVSPALHLVPGMPLLAIRGRPATGRRPNARKDADLSGVFGTSCPRPFRALGLTNWLVAAKRS